MKSSKNIRYTHTAKFQKGKQSQMLLTNSLNKQVPADHLGGAKLVAMRAKT